MVAGDLANGGGANRVIRDLAAIFVSRLGAEVTILSVGSNGPPTYPYPPEVKVERADARGPRGYFEAIRRLRRTRPDAVIGSWTQDNILLAVALLFTGIQVVAVEHTCWYFHPRWIRAVRRLAYRFASHVIVLNPDELRYYRGFLTNVSLLPNPVPAVARVAGVEREKLIVAIGHLEPRKNFQDAIRAMAISGLESSGWSCAIIGSGPEEPALRRQIAEAGLTRTSVVPPTDDLASWYSRASLTLVTAKLEVFSLVLAEAMSAGVIPIAYAADGPAFILQDFPGHLVAQGDVDGLAAGLREFAGYGPADQLRTRLEASVGGRFSAGAIAQQWQELLQHSCPRAFATAVRMRPPSDQT